MKIQSKCKSAVWKVGECGCLMRVLQCVDVK